MDAYRCTGSGSVSDESYSTTTMYGVQQLTNDTKMTNTVFTRRIVFIVATKLTHLLAAACNT